jgi:hypothetical protein
MMTMKKILLVGACAGLLAFSAAPASAAGPMLSGINSGTVQNVEYRWDRWQGRRTWQETTRPHYYSPGNSQWSHSHAPWYSNGNWGNHRYNPPGHWRYDGHHPGYWHR